MKRSNVTSPQQEDDMMSHSSLSFVDDIACNDATSLKRFLKGAMKKKDEELTRLHEEKFGLMEEMGRLKEKVEIQAKMILQVSKEKEQAMEQVKDVVVEMAKMLVQVQNEKEEAAKEVKACKEKLEESNQKILKAVKEKEVAIESARKSKEEFATTNTAELEHRVKISECKFAELEEKCSAESELVSLFQADTKKEIAVLQIVVAELEENVKEGMTEMIVQAAKEEEAKATRGRKAEIADMVNTFVNTALNEQKANVADLMTKIAESTFKLAQTELSHQEALQKISNLEKKMEEAGIQSAREIEEAMEEMKEEMKAQGEEMTQVRKEKDAALESKLCIMKEVKELKEKLEMLVQAQKDNEKAIQEVTKKFLQAQEEKEAAIKSAKQKIAESNSKLVTTELSQLEKEVWKSTGTKLVSHSGGSRLDDVLNCAPLKSGTFEWKIQVHTAHCLRLGVIGSSLELPLDDDIGCTNKTWGY